MLAPYGGASAGDDRRWRGRVQEARPAAVHQLQPAARRAAVHVTDAEAKEGLAILDEVLTEVDAYYQG